MSPMGVAAMSRMMAVNMDKSTMSLVFVLRVTVVAFAVVFN